MVPTFFLPPDYILNSSHNQAAILTAAQGGHAIQALTLSTVYQHARTHISQRNFRNFDALNFIEFSRDDSDVGNNFSR